MQTTLAQFNEIASTDAFALQNGKMLRVALDGGPPFLARLGSLVAAQGEVSAAHAGSGGLSRLLKTKLTGEGLPLMELSGRGTAFLAAGAQDVHLVRLEDEGMTVSGERILAFEGSVTWDVERVKGVTRLLRGGGLFTIGLRGTGWVAVLSDGPPVLLDVGAGPTSVDPDAVISWADGVKASVRTDLKVGNLIGRSSGEAVQLGLSGSGWVLVQPSEGRVAPDDLAPRQDG